MGPGEEVFLLCDPYFRTLLYIKKMFKSLGIIEYTRCLYYRHLLNLKCNLRFEQHHLKNSISKTEQRIPEISEGKL